MLFAFFNDDGRVDIAINDDTVTNLPATARLLTDAQWEKRFDLLLVNDELIDSPAEPEAPTPEEIISRLTIEIQKRLDGFARTRGYDSVNSSAKYKEISDAEIAALPEEVQADVTKFRLEARYLALKTAETWARCYLILGQFQSSGDIPTDEDVMSQLPELDWPV